MSDRLLPRRHPAIAGTVYLVGAGPGDPGLLTVHALQLIRQADVVLHDHLVSAGILVECGAHALVVDVGKIGHGPQADQRSIERQLIAFARAGLRVVRLKGGDPLIFGRGSEEASALSAADIPFEIVPGVSSAIAAPAYAGIPLTARGIAASVAIVTGHCANSRATLPAIPAADTVVVLMGIAGVEAIRDQLIASGRSADTPAAVIEWATCPQQRVAVGTLTTLPDVIAQERMQPPAVIVIGETVRLRSQLSWLDSPLLQRHFANPRDLVGGCLEGSASSPSPPGPTIAGACSIHEDQRYVQNRTDLRRELRYSAKHDLLKADCAACPPPLSGLPLPADQDSAETG